MTDLKITEATTITTADGLRRLADFIDHNPHLTEPLEYAFHRMLVAVGYRENPKAIMAAFAKASGKATKVYDDQWAGLDIEFAPSVTMHVYASRDKVCERVVTGTETVTKTVPDPDALAAVPTVEVTETVETVEWICTPLLAPVEVPAC